MAQYGAGARALAIARLWPLGGRGTSDRDAGRPGWMLVPGRLARDGNRLGAAARVLGARLCNRSSADRDGRRLRSLGAKTLDQLNPAGEWTFDRRRASP